MRSRCHRGEKILRSRCHRSARLTYALLTSIFLKFSPRPASHRARVGEGEGVIKLLVVLRVDGTHQSYLLVVHTLQKRADHVIATIPCFVVEYMRYSRAIEEKKYCIGAIKVHDSLTKKGFPPLSPPHDSLTHCLSDYLHFLA